MRTIITLLVFAFALSLVMAPAMAAITCTGTDSTKSIVVGETGDITVSCSGITSGSVEVNAQYSSNCLELKDSLPTLTSGSPSAQITFEATSMSCQYDSSDRTVTWSFTKPGESISSQNTLITITSPLSVTGTFKNAPYAATSGNTITVILEISTGAAVDITDVDVDMSSTHASLRGVNKISDNWNDNTIYSSGSQKTIQKSWSFAAPSAGSYTIAAIVTTQNAGGDQESTTLIVTGGGNGGSPGGGPAVGGAAPEGDDEGDEGQTQSRKPELVPGVGLRNNLKLQAALQKVLGLANMSEQARENMIRLSQSISSNVQMEREINVQGGKSIMTTKMKYLEDKKITNFLFYDSVPKTFAQSALNITVTSPGATYEIVEADPSFVFVYPELTFGEEITISYEVSEEVDTSVIDSFSGEVYAEDVQEFACAIDQRRCTGNDLEQCNNDRSGWEFVETCEYGCYDGACSLTPFELPLSLMWIIVVIIIVAVIIIAAVITLSKRKKKASPKFKFESGTPGGTPSSPESEGLSKF